MAIALYNPRVFETAGRKTVNTASIRSFVWSHARWDLKVNELKKFPDEVGKALLKHYSFLVKVDNSNIKDVKSMIEVKKYKCTKCAFESNYKMAFVSHMKTHEKENKETSEIEDIEAAQPKGQVGKPSNVKLSPENLEGIPTGSAKDKDGIAWYGEGLEKDSIDKKI